MGQDQCWVVLWICKELSAPVLKNFRYKKIVNTNSFKNLKESTVGFHKKISKAPTKNWQFFNQFIHFFFQIWKAQL